MPRNPLGTLPLSAIPYSSRITDQYGFANKNYYIVGFNPGYALQASELNEIQELFFLNHSLTVRQNALWSGAGYKLPFWEGLVPLDPNSPQTTAPVVDSAGVATATLTAPAGWYLWTDYSSGLSFWIYLNTDIVQDVETGTGEGTEYIGFEMTKELILCCPTSTCSTTQDETLRDNSQGNAENFFTCGASRFKVSFPTEMVVRGAVDSSDASNFYPIFKITKTDSATGYVATVTYYDGQQLRTST